MALNIYIYCNMFTLDNKLYEIICKHTFDNGMFAKVQLCDLKYYDGPIQKIIVKKFYNKNHFMDEKEILQKITNEFKSINCEFYHKILYYDELHNILIYKYLGKTLSDYNTKKLTVQNKLKLFKDLINMTIILNEMHIVHNDIKPCNIVIDQKNNKAFFVDFGVSQFIFDAYHYGKKFDTTLWSASPEYYLINEIIDQEIWILADDTINMYKKSQLYPLAGILIGLLMDDIQFYFRILYEFVNFEGENEAPMIVRFKNFNYKNKNNLSLALSIIFDKIKSHFKINNIDMRIYDLIVNMLQLNHNDRMDYSQIFNILNQLIDNPNSKIIEI